MHLICVECSEYAPYKSRFTLHTSLTTSRDCQFVPSFLLDLTLLQVRKDTKDGNKKNPILSKLWETLLFGTVGEHFEESDVVGCVLAIRPKEDILSVWNKDNEANPNVRFQIGERLKSLLTLDDNSTIEYKDNQSSMRDKSSFRNARPYMFAVSKSVPGPSSPPLPAATTFGQQSQAAAAKSPSKHASGGPVDE
jgi:hypothetical protein